MTVTQIGALLIAAACIITARLWLLELRDRRYRRRQDERRADWLSRRTPRRFCMDHPAHSYWPEWFESEDHRNAEGEAHDE